MNSESLKKVILLIILIAFLGFIGCTTEEEEEIGVTTVLEGSWGTGCTTGTNDDGEPEYKRETETFTGNSLTFGETGYQEATCATKIFEIRSTGTIAIGDSVTGVDGAKKIDFTLSDILYLAYDANIVSWLNENNFFGISDWIINTPKSLLGIELNDGCGVLNAGMVYYDIFKIDGDKLYRGDDSETCIGYSEALRPTTLDTDYITKQ